MELVNVPLFLCIRRTTTVFTLLAEWIMLGRVQSLTVQGSVAVIVIGALIAGWESLQSDPLGIGYTLLNNVCTAASMSFVRAAPGGRGSLHRPPILHAYAGPPLAD